MIGEIEVLPGLGLGTLALLVTAGCAAFAVAGGLLRLVLGVGMLAISVLVGFWVWQRGLGWWAGVAEPPASVHLALGIAAAAAVFWLSRRVVRAVADPLGHRDGGGGWRRPGPARRVVAVVLSLVPAALMCFVLAVVLRHLGSQAELRALATPEGGPAGGSVPPMARVKQSIDRWLPASWFQWIDPLSGEARMAVARWLAEQVDDAPAAAPKPGQPAAATALLDDPELREMVRAGRFGELLRDPRVEAALQDPALLRSVLAADRNAKPAAER